MAKAELALTQSEVNLDHATLVAPIAGTVATMPFTAGDPMTTSESVTILGSGSTQVTIDVPETSITQVKVGQAATVAVSAGTPSTGTVTSIGILPASSTTSATASYPVIITVPKPNASLAPGVTGSVSVTIAHVAKAVVLPVSAVTKTTDTSGTVTTLGADNKTTVTRVVLGASGDATVAITSGLAVGQRVVLADNEAALPASNTATLRRAGAGGTGGFGAGAGGFAGGAPPGGAPVGGR